MVKYQILVVEDQEEIRNIVEKYLIKEGYSVLTARDGFEALNKFNTETIHLILLDIMMPGIDGFEVLQEIRTISEIPVIMLTAKQEEVELVSKILEKEMKEAASLRVSLDVDLHTGKDWYEAK